MKIFAHVEHRAAPIWSAKKLILFEEKSLFRATVCTAMLLVVLSLAAIFAPLTTADHIIAQNAITSAKKALKDCYIAVSEAESSGANVDSLVATLNKAAGKLSLAELAYESGNYDSAFSYATQAQSALSGLISQTSALKQSAAATVSQNAQFTFLTLLISLTFLCSGVTIWVVLNRRERRCNRGNSTL